MRTPFSVITALYIAILVTLILLNFGVGVLLIPTVTYLIYVIYGVCTIKHSPFIKSSCSNYTKPNQIAITFDDGPSVKNSIKIVKLLNRYSAKATFFVIGEKLEREFKIAEEIIESGHTLGNHTYSHSVLSPIKSVDEQKEEIIRCNILLDKLGVKNRYFRPPFGVTNPLVAKAVEETNSIPIGWSIRSFDTKEQNRDRTLKRVLSKIRGGDIILFHDNTEEILWLLEQTLIYLKSRNIEAVTIDRLFDME